MIKKLKWDSNFFNKNIGSITVGKKTNLDEFEKDLLNFRNRKFDCVYVLILKERRDLIRYSEEKNFFLADRKVIYSKKAELFSESYINIQTKISKNKLPRLVAIVKEISRFSRFYKDPNFRPFALRLYKLWIENSIFKNYADKCFFALDDRNPVGLLILKRKSKKLYIDLFGVAAGFRRKGIGKALLQAAGTWAKMHRFNKIFVPTQLNNKIAVSVYKKYGFKYHKEIFIYHLWKKT